MKNAFIILFTLLVSISQAQIKEGEDGRYYDEKGNLYSGEYTENFESGALNLKMNISEGQPDGAVTYFYENGKTKEIRSYVKGLMNGKWEEWNIDGVKIAEANYINNKKDGKWYVWDDTGVLRYDMEYKDGEKVGVWIIYNEKGEVIQQKDFTKN